MRSFRISRPISATLLVTFFFACCQAAQNTGDTPPGLLVRNEPEYSAEAARVRAQSIVMLSIVIGEDGKARDVRVANGAGFGLDEKAIEAVETWVFKPATKDGKPVPYPANIEMNFNMRVRDPEDHTGQLVRLNFTLPANANRPELIVGKLPGNPTSGGDQALKFHLQVDAQGVPKNVTALSSTDKVWEKQVQKVVQTWRFRPASLDGKDIAAEADFVMEHTGTDEVPPVQVTLQVPEEEKTLIRRFPAPVQVAGLISRSHHTATRLENGTVLIAGGAAHRNESGPGAVDFYALQSSQIFDWATRRIVNTSELLTARQNHTATLLKDGTVLIAGGRSDAPLASAEIFDPSTGKFSTTGNLHEARDSHSASLLPDGRVLICGGTGVGNKYLASVEIYEPRTKSFVSAGNMTTARSSFQAVVLKNGVLLLGGFGAAGGTAEIYDPARGTFRAAGNLTAARYGFSATALPDGKVLVAGGSFSSSTGPATNTAEIYDPTTGAFHATGALTEAREFHTAMALEDGRVLISGGIPGSPGTPIAVTEVYDSVAGSFAAGSTLAGRHTGHTSTLLQDGGVLITGSGLVGQGTSAELIRVN